MTVNEWLQGLEPAQLVKIGAEDGTCFVYCGRVDSLDPDSIDMSACNYSGRFQREKKPVDNGLPLLEREIVKTYQAISEPAMICIYKGCTRGKAWMCDESDKPVNICREGAERLAMAIYGLCADDMKTILKTHRRKKQAYTDAQENFNAALEMTANLERMHPTNAFANAVNEITAVNAKKWHFAKRDLLEAKSRFQYEADWLCGDEYGILSDPVGVVESVIRAEREEHENNGMGTQRQDRRRGAVARYDSNARRVSACNMRRAAYCRA